MTIDPTGEDENKDSKISIKNVPIVLCQTFYSLKNLFPNRKIHLWIRFQFLNSFIRSRLSYNCANWSLTKAQQTKLNATERN